MMTSPYSQISVSQLHDMLQMVDGEKPNMLDVREPWEWQLARIEGVKHLPMGQIPAAVDDLDKTRPTVIICHHGTRSLQVVAFLQRQGFTNLHNLQGGIDAWSREIDPTVALY
jgi:rhodanese-related sulfurtransferase